MKITAIKEKDAKGLLLMLKQLDTETNFMMLKPDERKTTTLEMETKIKDAHNSHSIMLAAETRMIQ